MRAITAARVASSRPVSLRYQFDSRRLLVKHFSSLSGGSATQLTISMVAQARAFSSASFSEFHNPQSSLRCNNLYCFATVFLEECCSFFFFQNIIDLKSLLTANHAKGKH